MEKTEIRDYFNRIKDIINLTNVCRILKEEANINIDRANLQKFLNGNDNVLKKEKLDTFYAAFQEYIIQGYLGKDLSSCLELEDTSRSINTDEIISCVKNEIVSAIQSLELNETTDIIEKIKMR